MKLPYSWLKDYIDVDLTPEELASKLVKSGFEVEGIENAGKEVDNVRICRITHISRHPNAERLQVCDITLGDRDTTIITAAANVFEGAVVPVALDGATLPGGRRIFNGQLRGLTSYGMFCGGNEIGVDDSVIAGAEVDGILILPSDAPVGADIRDYLGLNESVFDISVTSNRPDCQGVIGIAREVSAILGLPMKLPKFDYKTVDGDPADYLSVRVEAPELCPNYYGAVVRNVKIGTSPKWMRDRLRWVGIRSINTIVDITNYVLTEIGQPMHAFDLRDIAKGQIVVRRAADQEKIVTLDDKVYEMTTNNLLIADAERAIGVAGVMGGKNSEIKTDTQTIAFEAARFARGNIRQTSRAMGMRSASSARFERGVDVWTTLAGMERALALVDELGAGEILAGKVRFEAQALKPRVIAVDIGRVNRLLGITVPTEEMLRILNALQIKTREQDGILVCEVPLYRDDIEDYTDIAEEIIRVYGYDHITPTLPEVRGTAVQQYSLFATMRLKSTLVGLGCYETATYSFVHPKCVELLNLAPEDPRRTMIPIKNPISEDFSVMRTTMAHNVLTVAALNLNRKNFDFRFFEISRVYLPKRLPLAESPTEETRLTVTVAGEKESFFTLKGILDEVASDFSAKFAVTESKEQFLHPGQAADITVKGAKIGYFGLVHPAVSAHYEIDRPVWFAELSLDALLSLEQKPVRFAPLPKFQEIVRDLALTVKDEVKAGEMLKTIAREAGSKLESVAVFDVYKGKQIEEGYKSVAFTLTFRSPDSTMTDDEVAAIMTKVSAATARKFNAKLRV